MRGRKPKPTYLRVLDGNAGKRPTNKEEPQPVGNLSEHAPPAWLSESQKDGWRFAMRNAPPGMLKRLDQSVLTVWVVAESVHRIAAEWVEKKGPLIMGKNGVPYQNPYLAIMNKQAAVMMKAAAELGFTPSSRSRVKVEPPKPGEGDPFSDLKTLTDD
jgi:P27 family predicted phage terminase small subunit